MMDDIYTLGKYRIPERWGEHRAREIQWAAKEGLRPGQSFILDLGGNPWCPLKWYFAAKSTVVHATMDMEEGVKLLESFGPVRFGERKAFLDGEFPGKPMDIIVGLGLWNTLQPIQMVQALERCHEALREAGLLITTLEEDGRFELNTDAAVDLLKMKRFKPDTEEIGRTSLGVRVIGIKATKA